MWALIVWKGRCVLHCVSTQAGKLGKFLWIYLPNVLECIYRYTSRFYNSCTVLFVFFEQKFNQAQSPIWRRWNKDTEESETLRFTHPWPANSVTLFWITLFFSHIFHREQFELTLIGLVLFHTLYLRSCRICLDDRLEVSNFSRLLKTLRGSKFCQNVIYRRYLG